ncbi:methyltransferase domain-containing protein [Sporosarcina sp. Marseille-Q4063]|uniref:tRNA (mnm(5)s(2)U34)-methyltransferase n=1 Tax=Sporosarcina sp. Marseille-Q4063 TaxID=2810514 RepID=UPI001BB0CC48|nr:class I SAM-dependent methyltransferase [Sporosarcina sp. Marseille-Q4063]QUW22762.1 methyltransferase domain-containing protein [Sporosarcina sp. Marseille-Q4063]
MKLLRVLPMAQRLLAESVNPGEIVVDATAGNGNDTQFLAGHIGEHGHVYAFDIQQAALDSTAKRLGELNSRVSLILDSHENVDQYVADEISGAIFNLGYLPHSEDLSIVTKPDSTIKALHKILNMLKVGGIISIAVYDGHEGGSDERDALLNYVQSLHQADFQVIKYEQLNRLNNPPFLVAIEKMRSLSQ